MPASRSARAMIFAPRSCPSTPGLATTTRLFECVSAGICSLSLCARVGARAYVPRGRRQDVDRCTGVLMGVRAREHLRIEPWQDAREHARREPLQIAHRHACDHLPDALAYVVGAIIGRATQAEAQVLVSVTRQATT